MLAARRSTFHDTYSTKWRVYLIARILGPSHKTFSKSTTTSRVQRGAIDGWMWRIGRAYRSANETRLTHSGGVYQISFPLMERMLGLLLILGPHLGRSSTASRCTRLQGVFLFLHDGVIIQGKKIPLSLHLGPLCPALTLISPSAKGSRDSFFNLYNLPQPDKSIVSLSLSNTTPYPGPVRVRMGQ